MVKRTAAVLMVLVGLVGLLLVASGGAARADGPRQDVPATPGPQTSGDDGDGRDDDDDELRDRAVVFDTFDGPASGLTAHVPGKHAPGGAWRAVSGDWLVRSGSVSDQFAQGISYTASIDPGAPRFDVSVDVTWHESTLAGLAFRHRDSANYLAFTYDGRDLALTKTLDSAVTVLARHVFNWDDGRSRKMRVKIDANGIEASVSGDNGVLRSVDQSLAGETALGLLFRRDNAAEFRDFSVVPLGPAVVPGQIVFPAQADALVFDRFDGAGPLSAHAPDKPAGIGWVEAAGAWTVAGGSVSETTGTEWLDHRAVIDAGRSSVDIYARLTTGSSGRAGIVFRYVDEQNWYMAWRHETYVLVGKRTAGEFTLLRIATFDWGAPGTSHTLRVRSDPESVHVFIDGPLPVFSLAAAELGGATKVGLFSRSLGAGAFDQFAVTVAGPRPQPPYGVSGLPSAAAGQVDQDSAQPPANGVLLLDTFTSLPWTPLTAHRPDIAPPDAGWEWEGGIWYAHANKAREYSGGLTDQRAVIETGVDQSFVSARLNWEPGTRAGIVFRYHNEGNWAMAWRSSSGDLVAGISVSGEFREVARVATSWEPGKTRRLGAQVIGDTATLYLDSEPLASFDVSQLTGATGAGLFSRTETPPTFDNFSVSALP